MHINSALRVAQTPETALTRGKMQGSEIGVAQSTRRFERLSGGGGCEPARIERGAGSDAPLDTEGLEGLLSQLLALLRALQAQLGGSGQAPAGTDDTGCGGGHEPGTGRGGVSRGEGTPVRSELGNANIPPPVDNLRTLQLGAKTLTIGGDGTDSASPAEVEQTAQAIEQLYQRSPTFRQLIDDSPHQALEVAVGRRSDNISWGGGGSVFMNLNNIAPGSADTFQALLAHEFAHAAADMQHGSAQDALQEAVAAEA